MYRDLLIICFGICICIINTSALIPIDKDSINNERLYLNDYKLSESEVILKFENSNKKKNNILKLPLLIDRDSLKYFKYNNLDVYLSSNTPDDDDIIKDTRKLYDFFKGKIKPKTMYLEEPSITLIFIIDSNGVVAERGGIINFSDYSNNSYYDQLIKIIKRMDITLTPKEKKGNQVASLRSYSFVLDDM